MEIKLPWSHKITQVVAVLVIAGGIFAAGFFVGTSKTTASNDVVLDSSKVSIALDPTGGFQVYNYTTKRLDRFSPEVGAMLFNLQAAQVAYGVNKRGDLKQ